MVIGRQKEEQADQHKDQATRGHAKPTYAVNPYPLAGAQRIGRKLPVELRLDALVYLKHPTPMTISAMSITSNAPHGCERSVPTVCWVCAV